MTTTTTYPADPEAVAHTMVEGDRIRFTPQSGNRWWTVRARDERYLIATQQAPFYPSGTLLYTVVDLAGWSDTNYNGAGGGPVRSSINLMGGGYELGPNGEGCDRMLEKLTEASLELSRRRVMNVKGIERSAGQG